MGLLRTTFFISGIFRQAEHNMDRSSARRAAKRARKNARSQAFWAARQQERKDAAYRMERDARKAAIDAATARIWAKTETQFCPDHFPASHEDNPAMRYWKADCPVCQPATALSEEDLAAVAALVARGTATQDVAEYVSSKTGLSIEASRAVLVDALPSMWV
jgi:hypothetical protein